MRIVYRMAAMATKDEKRVARDMRRYTLIPNQTNLGEDNNEASGC